MNKLISGLCLLALFSLPAQASEDKAVLKTSGYGEVIATPDMATFSVAIESTEETPKLAKEAVDRVVVKLSDALDEAGIQRNAITSSNLMILPRYDYKESGKRELLGYQGTRTITVNIDELEKLNQYLDVALTSGINRIDRIELKIKDPALFQQKARKLAIEDANQKAKAVANGFDSTVSGIGLIEYQYNNNYSSMPKVAMAMDSRSRTESSYQDTSLTISDSVNVEFYLTPKKSEE